MDSNGHNAAAERGFLLHVFHRPYKGRDVLYAVGKLESGETFGLMDTRLRPFCYCRVSDREGVERRVGEHGVELIDGDLATVDGERVLRVECSRVGALRRLAQQLEQDGIRTYEADLNFGLHCLMEQGLRGAVRIDGEWQTGKGVDRVYVDAVLSPVECEPELALLVLDIETAPDASEVYAVSLVGGGTEAKHRVEEIHLVGETAAAPCALPSLGVLLFSSADECVAGCCGEQAGAALDLQDSRCVPVVWPSLSYGRRCKFG